jgi:hypothetical protein
LARRGEGSDGGFTSPVAALVESRITDAGLASLPVITISMFTVLSALLLPCCFFETNSKF